MGGFGGNYNVTQISRVARKRQDVCGFIEMSVLVVIGPHHRIADQNDRKRIAQLQVGNDAPQEIDQFTPIDPMLSLTVQEQVWLRVR